jgi:hypothetical protein
MKRQIPLIITFSVGALLVLAMFIPHDPFAAANDELSVWFDIIASFAFILGGGNLLRIHGDKIYRRRRDWPYSIVTLGGFLLMLGAGLWSGAVSRGNAMAPGSLFQALYVAAYAPMMSTMYSLLAFFVASASYRAFRAKTREATVLLLAAFVILVGRTPVGYHLTSWIPQPFEFLEIPNLFGWILAYPNTAGQRAIMIGIALGIISTSLRLILGIERSHLGGD